MEIEPIAKELFDILCCPQCNGKLKYTEGKKGLECADCRMKYPIEEGIPILQSQKGR